MFVDYSVLEKIVKNNGVGIIGITSKNEMPTSSRFKSWQENCKPCDVEYLKRPAQFYFNLENIIPDAKYIISLAFFYENSHYKLPKCEDGYGRIARFAFGKNYHKVIKKTLMKIRDEIHGTLDDSECAKNIDKNLLTRVFVDAVPLAEREIARKSSLGFIGKSSMLINQEFGSYFFIGDIVTSIDIKNIPNLKNKRLAEQEQRCENCNACIKACKNHVKENGFFDINKCTSYLTIEKKGIIKKEDWHLISDWIFGCDICQVHCRHNKNCKEVKEKIDLGNSVSLNGLISLKNLLSIKTENEFLDKFKGTSLMRAGRENIIRNALIVIANKSDASFIDDIDSLSKNDESEVVRETASEVFNFLKL